MESMEDVDAEGENDPSSDDMPSTRSHLDFAIL